MVFGGLKFCFIGLALIFGWIFDFVVYLDNWAVYYVVIFFGGVWKMENVGIIYEFIFDG